MSLVGVVAAPQTAGADTKLCGPATDYSCTAPFGYNKPTPVWGSDPGHNCLSYVGWRLQMVHAVQPWPLPIGNAIEWDDKARAVGYRVDHLPTTNSVMQWNTGQYGHVAIVDEVYNDRVVISEDAYVSDSYGYTQRRSISRNETLFQSANFLHIKDYPYRRGDADGDNRVNAVDLSMVLSHDDQRRQNDLQGDVNRDGYVGAADMAIVLGAWTW